VAPQTPISGHFGPTRDSSMPLVSIPEADEPVEVPPDAIEVQDGEDLVIKSQDELDDTIQSRLSRQERQL